MPLRRFSPDLTGSSRRCVCFEEPRCWAKNDPTAQRSWQRPAPAMLRVRTALSCPKTCHKAPLKSTGTVSIPSKMEKKHTRNSVSPFSEFVFSLHEQDPLTSEETHPTDTCEKVHSQSGEMPVPISAAPHPSQSESEAKFPSSFWAGLPSSGKLGNHVTLLLLLTRALAITSI